MKNKTFLIAFLLLVSIAGLVKPATAMEPIPRYYTLRIYHYKTQAQEQQLDTYLEKAYKPAAKRITGDLIGVFKTLESDTDKRIYVLTTFKKWDDIERFDRQLSADKQYNEDGKDYLNAAYNNVPYTRFETVVLHAFKDWRVPFPPQTLTAPKSQRIYELRSYEGPTEKYYQNKVKMFNEGGETVLFARLKFNAVFYAEVIVGSHMPNLMYMTTFNSKEDRDAHWKTFGDDPEWKTLVAKDEYQHNVSKADILFLHPAEYSDF